MGIKVKKELKGLALALVMTTCLASRAFADVMPKTTSVITRGFSNAIQSLTSVSCGQASTRAVTASWYRG